MSQRSSMVLETPLEGFNSYSTNRKPSSQTGAAMSILLDKIVPVFAYPAGFAVLSALGCLLFLAWGWKRTGLTVLVCGTLYMWLAATPVVAAFLASSLERQYPVVPVQNLTPADVIVVLGGSIDAPTPLNPNPDVQESVDRVIHAARLFKAGLAPRIIASGGQLFPDPDRGPEAEYTAQLLGQLGVSETSILQEGNSRNTYENGVLTARLMAESGFETALLVTSAWHMPRALAVFRRAGIRVTPVSIDTLSSSINTGFPFGYLPSADALLKSTICLKEWIGFAVYRLRGWV